MKMPVIKPDLVRSLGHQMENTKYLLNASQEFGDENPYLSAVIDGSLDIMNKVIEDPEQQQAIQIIARSTVVMVYQAIKQQLICDEFE